MGRSFELFIESLKDKKRMMAEAMAQKAENQQRVWDTITNVASQFKRHEQAKNEYRYIAESTGLFDPNKEMLTPDGTEVDYVGVKDRMVEASNDVNAEIQGLVPLANEAGGSDPRISRKLAMLHQRQKDINEKMNSERFTDRVADQRWQRYYSENKLGSPEYAQAINKYNTEKKQAEFDMEMERYGQQQDLANQKRLEYAADSSAQKEDKPLPPPMKIKDAIKLIDNKDPTTANISVKGAGVGRKNKAEDKLVKLKSEYIRTITSATDEDAMKIFNEFITKWDGIVNGESVDGGKTGVSKAQMKIDTKGMTADEMVEYSKTHEIKG